MGRWAVCWLLMIALTTSGVYWGTNAAVAGQNQAPDDSYAMLPVGDGGPGTSVC